MSQTPQVMFSPLKLLVPIDVTSSFHTALHAAADLAKHFSAELSLFSVVPRFPTEPFVVPAIATISPGRASPCRVNVLHSYIWIGLDRREGIQPARPCNTLNEAATTPQKQQKGICPSPSATTLKGKG